MGYHLRGLHEAGSTSSSFADRLRNRDAATWEVLTDVYGSLIQSRYRQAGVPLALAEELTAQVMSDVVTGIESFRHASFRGWLWTIAQRRLVDAVRRMSRGGGEASLDDSVVRRFVDIESWKDWKQREQGDLAKSLFHSLCHAHGWSELQQEAIYQYLSGSLDGTEAARLFGISSGAFYQRVSRLLRELRRMVLDDESGQPET